MAYAITPEQISDLKAFIKEHPIDHAYDDEAEYLDGDMPEDQHLARLYYQALKELGEIE